jgi:acetyl esterase
MALDQTGQAVIDQLETWFQPTQANGAADAPAPMKAAPFIAGPTVDQVVDLANPGPAGDIPIRLSRRGPGTRPVVVRFHGGGWALATEAVLPPPAAPTSGGGSPGPSPGGN